MTIGSLLFRITAIAIFVQLLLGGLLTFDFINAGVHILMGIVVFVLAIGSAIVSLVSKPEQRSLQITSFVMVALIIGQMILGLDTLDTGNQVIAWIHFVNAIAIYSIALLGTFIALRSDQANKVESVLVS
ncbi:MAG: hypothetical protein JRN15_05235 [Nitrososphaerota archaeon]|nr:hypothetical protein [Nitrososphaerota archaeon]